MKLNEKLDIFLEKNIKKFYTNLDIDGGTFFVVKNLAKMCIFSVIFAITFFILSSFKNSKYFLGMNIISTSKSFLFLSIFSIVFNFCIFIFQKLKK
ncbi:MAG: hypothetical protein E6249_09660 [Peptoniphilus grossensis]|uniref:hypothetical protein n=1 Tax=Peptoniphilus grossensis TaxID=1465756 RepID=UPI002907D762|nr:hypothetical protein [Peptoniphilus grossensis]MDU5100712.1 hypothetical protein [Peptoniphilus grossensis]